MVTNIWKPNGATDPPKEGDLYKRITVLGRTFTLRYGYYEEFERYGLYNEPMPIYPDFANKPMFTADGTPFATEIQDICSCYQGEKEGDCCGYCRWFRRIEDLFGICMCPGNRKTSNKRGETI